MQREINSIINVECFHIYNVELGHGRKKMNENNQANLNEGIREFFPREWGKFHEDPYG